MVIEYITRNYYDLKFSICVEYFLDFWVLCALYHQIVEFNLQMLISN